MLSILSLILWLIMIDTSSYPWTNLLQDSNFLVSKLLNTSEFRVYLITKILIYMSPRSHSRGPGSHLVILRSWVRMALFRYALIYNCSVVDKGYQKNLKNQVYHISSIYKYYYARKTTFRGNSEKIKTKTKKNKGLSFYCQGLPDYKACEVVELKNNLENTKNDDIVFPTCHLL